MTERQTRSIIRDRLQRHGIRARRSLGQNFLADPNVVERIVRVAAVGPGDRVLEVGAGTGTLTAALAGTGASVLAFEVDTRLEPVLEEAVGPLERVEVRFEDVMEADLGTLLAPEPCILVANLPYGIGARFLIHVMKDVPLVERAVVMLQREVADRLGASPGSPDYGLASVAISLRATVKREFDVSPDVFLPRPEVDSSVISVTRIDVAPAAARADVLSAAAFNQRRKMLRRSLSAVVGDPEALLLAAGLEPTARAEELSPADYLRLAEAAVA